MGSEESQADRALLAVRQGLQGPRPWQRADRASTLHMLKGLAPRFFARHALRGELAQALDALDELPAEFPPQLDLDEGMSRVDALYFRRLHGLAVKPFASDALADYIAEVRLRNGLLPAWLMGEQARLLGVRATPALNARFPFQRRHPVLHLYFLTHLVMLDTHYFGQPPLAGRYADELRHMEQAMDSLVHHGSWDLLAQCEICLAACRRSHRVALEALRLAQSTDGRWCQPRHDERQNAHTTAAALVALAIAEEGQGSGPG